MVKVQEYYKKSSLATKYILPLDEDISHIKKLWYNFYSIYPDYPRDKFYDILLKSKERIRYDQKLIKNTTPAFYDEYIESESYQDLILLLDLYKKEIRDYLKFQINPIVEQTPTDNLKEFYKLFDDKTLRLSKEVYLQIKEAIKNNFIADLESYYYKYELPQVVKKFIEKLL